MLELALKCEQSYLGTGPGVGQGGRRPHRGNCRAQAKALSGRELVPLRV